MKSIGVIIAARGGSKRLPEKTREYLMGNLLLTTQLKQL